MAYYQKGSTGDLDLAEVAQKSGAIAAFLDLYDQLPHELVRPEPADYAVLVAAIGAIRLALDQYRGGTQSDCLRPIRGTLSKAWTIIAKLPDEVPSTSHDLSFIHDAVLREMIQLDISASQARRTCFVA